MFGGIVDGFPVDQHFRAREERLPTDVTYLVPNPHMDLEMHSHLTLFPLDTAAEVADKLPPWLVVHQIVVVAFLIAVEYAIADEASDVGLEAALRFLHLHSLAELVDLALVLTQHAGGQVASLAEAAFMGRLLVNVQEKVG